MANGVATARRSARRVGGRGQARRSERVRASEEHPPDERGVHHRGQPADADDEAEAIHCAQEVHSRDRRPLQGAARARPRWQWQRERCGREGALHRGIER